MTMTKKRDDLLLWIDIETTGLDPYGDAMLEIAAMVTDRDLKIVAPLRNHVLHHCTDSLEMSDYVWKMHSVSGLLDEVYRSDIDSVRWRRDVEDALCLWLSGIAEPGTLTPAGNSVNFDVGFLRVHMPRLYGMLHYRQLNVSSIALCAGWWFGDLFEKQKTHRTASDLLESYGELCWLHDHLDWRIG
jgi:oligoribonuclease